MHRSTILLLASLAFVGGVGVGELAGPLPPLWLAVIPLAVGVGAAIGGPRVWWIAVIACALVFGIWRIQNFTVAPAGPPDFGWQDFSATVVREPELRQDQQRLVLRPDAVAGSGLVQASLPLQPRYQYGDQVQVGCTLEPPEPIEDFRYDKYLERYGIVALCRFPQVEYVGAEPSFTRLALATKLQLKLGLQRALAPPEHGVLVGALFGDKRAVPQSILDQFQATGTTHLLVISGAHVVLLSVLVSGFLQSFGSPRRVTLAAVFVAILGYVFITGWQPSAVRSVIFGSAAIIAELFGRPYASLRILVISAAAMLAGNPMLLFWDAGFQLSFLATFGIVVFTRWVEGWSGFLPAALGLRTAFATSVAAILATTPLIAFQFHQFSPVAFIANVVLVPLMPLEMVGGIVVMLAAVVWPPLAEWLGLPVYYLVKIMLDLVAWFAAWPYASLALPQVPVWLFGCTQVAVLVFAARLMVSYGPRPQRR
jgi:competence protein ComEC